MDDEMGGRLDRLAEILVQKLTSRCDALDCPAVTTATAGAEWVDDDQLILIWIRHGQYEVTFQGHVSVADEQFAAAAGAILNFYHTLKPSHATA